MGQASQSISSSPGCRSAHFPSRSPGGTVPPFCSLHSFPGRPADQFLSPVLFDPFFQRDTIWFVSLHFPGYNNSSITPLWGFIQITFLRVWMLPNYFDHIFPIVSWIGFFSKDSYIHSTKYLGVTCYMPGSRDTMVNKMIWDSQQESDSTKYSSYTEDWSRGRGGSVREGSQSGHLGTKERTVALSQARGRDG